jgi:hypothetical protein
MLFQVLGLAGVLLAVPAFAGQVDLIREVEKLRNSLGPRDPARNELSLRLADLYFYQGAELAQQADLSPEDPKSPELSRQAVSFRQKSLALYQTEQPALQGEKRIKVLFQMARLTQELGQREAAQGLWKQLAAQQLQPTLRNEAVLRLGEMSEEDGTSASLREAETYYTQVIQECRSGDLCPYVKFRLAWLLRNQNRFDPALQMMKDALWDAKGQVREDSLRDLIVFYAAQPSDGEAALADVDALSAKLHRPELVSQLSSAFFSNGNKAAGVRVLEFLDSRSTSIPQKIRLLEELYGLRQWDRYRAQFLETEQLPTVSHDAPSSEALEQAEKTLRRLVVQLDGERIGDPSRLGDFQSAVMLYLRHFPAHPDKFKLMEGWIAAEPDALKKEQRIKAWINDANLALSPAQTVRLREIRIASAQKHQRFEQVIEEAMALAAVASTEKSRREYQYAQARALYELKNLDSALELFRKLAAEGPAGEPDSWAVLSQNLALDILAQRKNYPEFLKQANTWLQDERLKKIAGLQTELADMAKVRDEVLFEEAAQKNDATSLARFKEFCQAGKFLPKSCQNAKVLAVQLQDQESLIELLKKEGNSVALASELEAAGRFAEAAAELESKNPLSLAKWSATDALKIALLYELGGQTTEQLRWLKALRASYQKRGKILPSENLAYQTFADAGLLDESTLKLPWSPETTARLAHELEARGQGNARTQKIMLDSKVALGAAWSKLITDRAAQLAAQQRQISFYGKNSRSKFQARIAALQKVDRFVKPYLEGADLKTRVSLLGILKTVYEEFSQEILSTPIPEGLDEATVAQVQASLEEMAAPFQGTGKDYARLLAEQSARLPADASGEGSSGATQLARVELKDVAPHMARLRTHPRDVAALENLKQAYQSGRHYRLASYFEGRIQQLKEKTP